MEDRIVVVIVVLFFIDAGVFLESLLLTGILEAVLLLFPKSKREHWGSFNVFKRLRCEKEGRYLVLATGSVNSSKVVSKYDFISSVLSH